MCHFKRDVPICGIDFLHIRHVSRIWDPKTILKIIFCISGSVSKPKLLSRFPQDFGWVFFNEVYLKNRKKIVIYRYFFQKCCHFCWLCFDFSKNDNTFERNEDCATVFLKWTDFSRYPGKSIEIIFSGHQLIAYNT